MKILINHFKFYTIILMVLAGTVAYIDFLIFKSIEISVNRIDIISIMQLVAAKLILTTSLLYGYSFIQLRLEMFLKYLVVDLHQDSNAVNYFTFVSQNLAFNYYSSAIRTLCELFILLIFFTLIIYEGNFVISGKFFLFASIGSALFVIYLYLISKIRRKAAKSQDFMVDKTLPIIKLQQQIKNNRSLEYAKTLIKGYCADYLHNNTLALFLSQLPRNIMDVFIILTLVLFMLDGVNLLSVSVVGLRAFSSVNVIMNQIPIILHFRPYLADLRRIGLEK